MGVWSVKQKVGMPSAAARAVLQCRARRADHQLARPPRRCKTPSEERTMHEPRTSQAVELMTQFAERTGLSAERPPERYLWTDAFAVCTFFGLERATGAELHKYKYKYKDLALKLIEQVHRTLGRH